ncbi:MAG: tetratricopeptide repeat protein, partial [Burkholderiales bacterium]
GEGDHEGAARSYQRALSLDPDCVPAHLNLGVLLQLRGETAEAVLHFRRACELAPDSADAWLNLGFVLERGRDLRQARECYDRALAIDPDHIDARFNRSMVLLAQGDYAAGWEDYEWRWQASGFPRPSYPQPEWDGAVLRGETVLLYTEQGFGDSIHFARYAALVAERGARVVLRCQAELQSLLRTVPGVSDVVTPEQAPAFDLHCSLLSVPRLFGTTPRTIPARIPYLRPDPARVEEWGAHMNAQAGFLKVGLVWASQSQMPTATQKSIALQALAPLSRARNVRFYSLQTGAAGSGAAPLAPFALCDLAAGIRDFADTAAIMANLDLTLSVDTAAAHLAGALGRPVWTMLPYAPDWRWYPESRVTPWYPQMRLYRQQAPGDWGSVCAKVAQDLKAIFPT